MGRKRKGPDPWRDLEWEEHPEAQRIVAENPGGMTLEEVGQHLDLTRERVRQIEAVALQKLRDGLEAYLIERAGSLFRILDCAKCGAPFVRTKGEYQKRCETCETKPRGR
jgi:hypothetical protein